METDPLEQSVFHLHEVAKTRKHHLLSSIKQYEEGSVPPYTDSRTRFSLASVLLQIQIPQSAYCIEVYSQETSVTILLWAFFHFDSTLKCMENDIHNHNRSLYFSSQFLYRNLYMVQYKHIPTIQRYEYLSILENTINYTLQLIRILTNDLFFYHFCIYNSLYIFKIKLSRR